LFGEFYSAIWDDLAAENTALTLTVSLGQNYYLKVGVGRDDVTGVGTPNAQAFADWFAPTAAKK
jgi:hypothetical protein